MGMKKLVWIDVGIIVAMVSKESVEELREEVSEAEAMLEIDEG